MRKQQENILSLKLGAVIVWIFSNNFMKIASYSTMKALSNLFCPLRVFFLSYEKVKWQKTMDIYKQNTTTSELLNELGNCVRDISSGINLESIFVSEGQ